MKEFFIEFPVKEMAAMALCLTHFSKKTDPDLCSLDVLNESSSNLSISFNAMKFSLLLLTECDMNQNFSVTPYLQFNREKEQHNFFINKKNPLEPWLYTDLAIQCQCAFDDVRIFIIPANNDHPNLVNLQQFPLINTARTFMDKPSFALLKKSANHLFDLPDLPTDFIPEAVALFDRKTPFWHNLLETEKDLLHFVEKNTDGNVQKYKKQLEIKQTVAELQATNYRKCKPRLH